MIRWGEVLIESGVLELTPELWNKVKLGDASFASHALVLWETYRSG